MSCPISAMAFSLASKIWLASWIVSAMSFLTLASSRSKLLCMLSNMMRSRRRLLICSRNCLLWVMLWLNLTYARSSRFSRSLMRFCTVMLCSFAVLIPPMRLRVVPSASLTWDSCWSSILVLRTSSTILRAKLSPSSCRELMRDWEKASPGRRLNLFSNNNSCFNCSFCERNFSMADLCLSRTDLCPSVSNPSPPVLAVDPAV
mmetsp:Transcript_22865/g.63198  ORF Transcript_22865/g.63198 Transcript_22865/m.63198 type:complete len:203 (+) Transcript_22865:1438-2046(+)